MLSNRDCFSHSNLKRRSKIVLVSQTLIFTNTRMACLLLIQNVLKRRTSNRAVILNIYSISCTNSKSFKLERRAMFTVTQSSTVPMRRTRALSAQFHQQLDDESPIFGPNMFVTNRTSLAAATENNWHRWPSAVDFPPEASGRTGKKMNRFIDLASTRANGGKIKLSDRPPTFFTCWRQFKVQ